MRSTPFARNVNIASIRRLGNVIHFSIDELQMVGGAWRLLFVRMNGLVVERVWMSRYVVQTIAQPERAE